LNRRNIWGQSIWCPWVRFWWWSRWGWRRGFSSHCITPSFWQSTNNYWGAQAFRKFPRSSGNVS
jgi:hypothetical protein